MQLFYTPGSPFSRIIRVLIRELEIDCSETAILEFPPSIEYFAINPLGQVPALKSDDGVRFPTRLIIDHLMEILSIPLPVWRAGSAGRTTIGRMTRFSPFCSPWETRLPPSNTRAGPGCAR